MGLDIISNRALIIHNRTAEQRYFEINLSHDSHSNMWYKSSHDTYMLVRFKIHVTWHGIWYFNWQFEKFNIIYSADIYVMEAIRNSL